MTTLVMTSAAAPSPLRAILPLILMLFVGYLVLGLALPALPLQVHDRLGLGTFAVGLAAGSQFAASLVSRMFAGRFTDRRGAKPAVLVGLFTASAAGLFYLLSLSLVATPIGSLALLLLGRIVLGVGESFLITGTLGWGLALLGAGSTGKAMSWLGTALYAAFAIGAPVGTALFAAYGFAAIGVATILIPFAAVLLALPIPSAPLQPPAPADVGQVLRAVWLPGSALALSGVGFSAVMTFVALLFAGRGWSAGWLAFTILSLAFIAGRATLGHLPDRIGGAKVAIACILVEAAGQALIWLAASPGLAFAGVALTGLGYSLVYPGLGVVAVGRAPQQSRGLAMGAYTAFLDVSLGFSGPLLGWLAGGRDLGVVYLAAMLAALCSACVALPLLSARWRVSSSESQPSS